MAFHGVQGRGVLVDIRHHLGDEWRPVGFATRVLEWDKQPDPREIFTTCSYLDAKDDEHPAAAPSRQSRFTCDPHRHRLMTGGRPGADVPPATVHAWTGAPS